MLALSFFFVVVTPIQYVYAGILCSSIGLYCEEEPVSSIVSQDSSGGNSQNSNFAAPALSVNTTHNNDESDFVSVIEGSAVSAGFSVSPSSGTDKPKTNLSSDQISVYVVHDGDTLSAVAKMFNVSANTIRWANDIPKGGALKIGQKLVILPVSGLQYTIKKGDTIAKIAKKYSADAGEIRDFNDIEDNTLIVGDDIIIPNGAEAPMPVITPIKKFFASIVPDSGVLTDGYFIRPSRGGKTQGIHGKNGVDFSARSGLAVVAAAGGTVLISRESGYNGGYGRYIVINHSNGTQTLYAHLSANFVSAGDGVSQGQLIGNIGNTGRSTGPHLHFEIHGAKNPF